MGAPKISQSHHLLTLENCPLLSGLKEKKGAIEDFYSYLDMLHFAKEQPIVSQGLADSKMYFLVAGSVRVLKTSVHGDVFQVAILRSEESPYFGEGAMLHDQKRSSTIEALEECSCLALAKKRFEEFCVQKPYWALPIVLHMATVLNARLKKQSDDFVLVYKALAEEIAGS